MKETFEDYLQRLKDRRTEDSYKYTDEDFIQYQEYIKDCYNTNLSVYKCLEFMSFAERDIDDTFFNKEPKQEQHNFLPGFIKQYDPKEGEINGEEWTVIQFLKWLELNQFKIIKDETTKKDNENWK